MAMSTCSDAVSMAICRSDIGVESDGDRVVSVMKHMQKEERLGKMTWSVVGSGCGQFMGRYARSRCTATSENSGDIVALLPSESSGSRRLSMLWQT